jgi:hypothetical protein
MMAADSQNVTLICYENKESLAVSLMFQDSSTIHPEELFV